MTIMKKVSVIIPVYNVENYLNKCVDSIINQTYTNMEIILIDDGSTDRSGEICDWYAAQDERIRVIHKKNGGLSDARNHGIEAATGEYVIFIDSDDYWIDNKVVERFSKHLENADIAVFDLKSIPDGQNEISVPYISSLDGLRKRYISGKAFLEELLGFYPIYAWYAVKYVIRRELLMSTGIRFPIGKKYEDSATTYKILLAANEVVVINEPLYVYRTQREGAITTIDSASALKELVCVDIDAIRDVQNRPDVSKELKEKLCSNFSAGYYVAVIRSMGCPKGERSELWKFLNENKWICTYSRSSKQVFGRRMVMTIGVRMSAFLLGIRRIFKEKF